MANNYEKIRNWAEKNKEDKGSFKDGEEAFRSLAKHLELPVEGDLLKKVLDECSGPGHKSATRNTLNKLEKATSDEVAEVIKNLAECAKKDAENCGNKIDDKGKREYSNRILERVERVCGLKYYKNLERGSSSGNSGAGRAACQRETFTVMLDHAARRVVQLHTWIKLAEQRRKKCEEDAEKIENVPLEARRWLDEFCEKRSKESGALEPYRIRRRALGGWEKVVAAWGEASCKNEADRIAVARALQDDREIVKFGDIQLFERLAEDEARCVWQPSGRPDAKPLIDYARAQEAEFDKKRFKVPAYRHPDPFFNPVFFDFGESRPEVKLEWSPSEEQSLDGTGATRKRNKIVELIPWKGRVIRLQWQSKRLERDLPTRLESKGKGYHITRKDRLGRAALVAAQARAQWLSGVDNRKNKEGKVAQQGSDNATTAVGFVNYGGTIGQGGGQTSNKVQGKDWNGRLQAPRKQLAASASSMVKVC